MDKFLLKWIEINKEDFKARGITIDELVQNDVNLLTNSTKVDLINTKKIARIIAFCSNRVYIEILDIKTTNTDFIYDDYIEFTENLESFFADTINKML